MKGKRPKIREREWTDDEVEEACDLIDDLMRQAGMDEDFEVCHGVGFVMEELALEIVFLRHSVKAKS